MAANADNGRLDASKGVGHGAPDASGRRSSGQRRPPWHRRRHLSVQYRGSRRSAVLPPRRGSERRRRGPDQGPPPTAVYDDRQGPAGHDTVTINTAPSNGDPASTPTEDVTARQLARALTQRELPPSSRSTKIPRIPQMATSRPHPARRNIRRTLYSEPATQMTLNTLRHDRKVSACIRPAAYTFPDAPRYLPVNLQRMARTAAESDGQANADHARSQVGMRPRKDARPSVRDAKAPSLNVYLEKGIDRRRGLHSPRTDRELGRARADVRPTQTMHRARAQ